MSWPLPTHPSSAVHLFDEEYLNLSNKSQRALKIPQITESIITASKQLFFAQLHKLQENSHQCIGSEVSYHLVVDSRCLLLLWSISSSSTTPSFHVAQPRTFNPLHDPLRIVPPLITQFLMILPSTTTYDSSLLYLKTWWKRSILWEFCHLQTG